MFRISYSRACQVFICVLPVLFQKASPLQLAFWKDRAGSGAHPQPGLPWRREGEPRGGGPLSPRLLSPASRGSPGEDRTSHAAGQTEAALSPSPRGGGPLSPHLLARLPSEDEPRGGRPPPISSPGSPPSPQPALLTSTAGESGSLETRALEGEHGCFRLQLSLPESRFQNSTGIPRKSQV